MAVDDEMIRAAMDALGVDPIRDLRSGGQKTVRLVSQGGTELVLKVVAVGSSSPEALRRAHREVELLQALDNRHVVKAASDLVELGDPVNGAAWLEEFLTGEDLSDLIGAEWSWEETLVLAEHVADGLSALHDVDVVHRDLSVNNVRRRDAGEFVVMDPGFARHILLSGITVGGQPGTPGFMSPEHLLSFSGAPTPASDVFCVGILVFLMLTAHLPIPYVGDASDYVSRLSRVESLDLETFRTDLAPEVYELARKCLHPQPARRFRNGTQLLEALRAMG